MQFCLKYVPIINAAAGVLANHAVTKCIVVDHLTINQVDPTEWNFVFLLAAEVTYRIRPEMKRIGDKLIVISTSVEPGLDRWHNFFFPHWLFCVLASSQRNVTTHTKPFLFDALLGRQKDERTHLLNELENADLFLDNPK